MTLLKFEEPDHQKKKLCGDTYACTIEGFNENGLVWDCELD